VSNHTAHSKGNCHPVRPCLCSKSVQEVSNSGIDKGETQGPETHFRLLYAAILACETDHNPVRQNASEPSNKVADESSKKDETCR
jgi:hypothetical protein